MRREKKLQCLNWQILIFYRSDSKSNYS
uniref:Uncharacterized protein n=1 Tax=Arundo donax TaxID=35708 RepID=A0A0A8ZUN5_ARUDO